MLLTSESFRLISSALEHIISNDHSDLKMEETNNSKRLFSKYRYEITILLCNFVHKYMRNDAKLYCFYRRVFKS